MPHSITWHIMLRLLVVSSWTIAPRTVRRHQVCRVRHLHHMLSGSSDLGRWHAASRDVPVLEVLPMGFGGVANVSTAAWHGDKILGAAVAQALREYSHAGPSDLTKLFSVAVSNENMATAFEEVLPPHHLKRAPSAERRAQQVHDCGTMVEACVERVASGGDMPAVSELARFLLARVQTETPAAEQHVSGTAGAPLPDIRPVPRPAIESNPKGRLLELGGSVACERVTGVMDTPIFRAEATLNDCTASALGGSRKGAERDATRDALAQAGFGAVPLPTERRRLDAIVRTQAKKVALRRLTSRGDTILLEPLRRRPEDLAANLKDGEEEPQWFARKPDMHRCLCAPFIFPEALSSVDAWVGRLQDRSLALVSVRHASDGLHDDVAAVEGEGDCITRLFWSQPAESTSKAQREASALAHRYILTLVHGTHG